MRKSFVLVSITWLAKTTASIEATIILIVFTDNANV